MKSLKSILLCSAAGVVAGGAAQAADLPVKKAAAAVQYVEACPEYGRTFYKMPGTEICVGMRGGLEAKLSYMNAREQIKENGKSFVVAKGASNQTGWMLKIKPAWDFRAPTEYGTLRTFFAFKMEQDNGLHEDAKPVLTGSWDVKIDKAIIEWAGFTIGLTNTQFAYWEQDDTILSIGGGPKADTMQLTYTFKPAKGWKATIGLEDNGDDLAPEISDLGGTVEDLNGLEPGGGPQRMYAIVGSLSTEGDWGDAKISGIVNPIQTFSSVAGPGAAGAEGVPNARETKWGWAALGGVTFMLPFLGPKDQFMVQLTHCDGVTVFCLDKALTRMDDKGFYLNGLARKDYDAFLLANASGTGWETFTTKVTSVAAQYRHYWAPLWRSNISGSWSKVTTPDVAKTFQLADGGLADATGYDVSVNLIWGKSRQTAEMGLELMYKKIDQDLPGDGTIKATSGPFEKDGSAWAVTSWIKRSW